MVLYDCMQYVFVADHDGSYVHEGFEGYIIKEAPSGSEIFVVYNFLYNGEVRNRSYVLPEDKLNEFRKLHERYRNYFVRDAALDQFAEQVEPTVEACNAFYERPENYIHFVAMDMVKSDFYRHVLSNKGSKLPL